MATSTFWERFIVTFTRFISCSNQIQPKQHTIPYLTIRYNYVQNGVGLNHEGL